MVEKFLGKLGLLFFISGAMILVGLWVIGGGDIDAAISPRGTPYDALTPGLLVLFGAPMYLATNNE